MTRSVGTPDFGAMKKIGIVGGVGWASTVYYYSEICRRSEGNMAGGSTPEMSIESLDLAKAAAFVGIEGDDASWSRFDEYHRAALMRLEASGADFALIASNTPHHRFEAIVRGVGIPVINIFDAVARECSRLQAGQVLILGTTVTMESGVFRNQFARRGIEAAGPKEDSARVLITDLIGELQAGKIEGGAERIEGIARSSFAGKQAARPVVCLACTELPLAFPESSRLESFAAGGMTYVNSSAVHVAAALGFAAAQ